MLQALHLFDPAARSIVATLFNSLWEDALLALIVATVLRFARNVNATTRYAVWISALVAAIILPIATTLPFVTVTHHLPSVVQLPAQTPAHLAAAPSTVVHHTASSHNVSTSPAAPTAAASKFRLPDRFRFSVPTLVAVGLFGLWALISLALLAKVLVGLIRLEALKRDSLPLPLEYRDRMARWTQAQKGVREVRLCVSDKIEVPVAVGLFDAMILIPKHLLDTLSQEEIDQISLHELAHLRRGDDWTNGLQRVIQALFFFNPAILWMAQQLDLEREVACDDWVLLQTNEVRPYAFCLTKMAEVTAWPHRAIAAPGVFVTRKSLSIRVERLLRAGRDIRTSVTFAPATIVGVTVIVLFFVLQSVAPSIAFDQEDTTVIVDQGDQHVVVNRHNGQSTLHVTNGHVYKAAAPIVRYRYIERTGPGIPSIPHIPSMAAVAPIPHISPMPRMHMGPMPRMPHVSVIPPMPKVAYMPTDVPNSAEIRAEVDRAMKEANVARVAANAARDATSHLHEFQNNTCNGCDMSGVNWAGRDLRGVHLTGADFTKADLHNVNFSGAVLNGVDFSRANLRGANFTGAKLTGCDLRSADITGVNFNVASFTGCDVDASHLAPDQARALLSHCVGCDFQRADLRNMDLRNVNLSGADLSNADLRGANLEGASFSGVDLSNAKLDGAHLNGARFNGCDFDGVDLHNVDLSHALITGGKFRN